MSSLIYASNSYGIIYNGKIWFDYIRYFVFYLAILLRVGDFSEGRRVISDMFFAYVSVKIVEFDRWFVEGQDFRLYQMGSNTYMVLPRVLGLAERMQGGGTILVYMVMEMFFTAFKGINAVFGLNGGLIYSFLRVFYANMLHYYW